MVNPVGAQHLIDQAVVPQTAVAVLTVDRVDDGDFPNWALMASQLDISLW